MRRGGRILIVLGVVLGVATFLGAFFLLPTGGGGGGGESAVPTKRVLVASQKIPARSIIPTTGAYTLEPWPENALPPGHSFITEGLTQTVIAAVPIERGQPIGENMIIRKRPDAEFTGYKSDASVFIPKGRVFISFPINQQASIAGAIRPGDRVDIMVSYPMAQTGATTSAQASSIRQITQYTLQDVEIVWIGLWPAKSGEQATEDARNAAFVTLSVDPQDALVLKFMRETALDIQFALRAADDRDKRNVEPVVIEYVDQRFNFQGSLGRSR
jgi:Flp pilus assembly protein CpaB